MERLTCNKLKTICDGYFVNLASKEEATKYRMLVESAPKYEELYKRLAEYENAEEQGLLLRLPVAIGSTVYVVDYTYECKFNYDCKLSFDEYKCEEDIRCEHECKKYRVKETRFNHIMLDKIGETVFLAKEEAEQALKQIRG